MCTQTKFCCFSDTAENAKTALMERVFYHQTPSGFVPPDIPRFEEVSRILRPMFRLFASMATVCPPVLLADYPAVSYTGRKRLLYERAVANVVARGERQSDSYLDTFLKHEKIMVKMKRLVPRVIQPRKPEYNVLVGRYIRHLERPVFGIINRVFGSPTVMKGMDAFAQGKAFATSWASFNRPCAIMLDASRFDQHVSIPMLRWEHSIYELFHSQIDRPELRRLLAMQLHNKGCIKTPDAIIKYKVDGCRCSGDMNTSMGNCLLMCSMIYCLLQQIHVSARLHNNGDDCCVIMNESDKEAFLRAVPQFFAQLGFVMVVEEVVYCLEEISFCQTHPVFDGDNWRMVRDPHVSMSKDATLLRKWSSKEYYAYLQCLGKAGLALTSGLPLLQNYYIALTKEYELRFNQCPSERLASHVGGVLNQTGMFMMVGNLKSVEKTVSDAARASFARAFRVLPEVQRMYEEYFLRFRPGENVLLTLPPDPLWL